MTEEHLRKETHQGKVVHPEREVKDRARMTLRNFTNPLCGHPPECHNYTSESGSRLGDKCASKHKEVDSQPSKSKKSGGRDQWPY